jgi:hypothetical protein
MNETTFVVIAIVAALALVGVVAVTIVTIPLQQAAAVSPIGQCASTLKNASASFCHTLR